MFMAMMMPRTLRFTKRRVHIQMEIMPRRASKWHKIKP
jgi:hypothetical protein